MSHRHLAKKNVVYLTALLIIVASSGYLAIQARLNQSGASYIACATSTPLLSPSASAGTLNTPPCSASPSPTTSSSPSPVTSPSPSPSGSPISCAIDPKFPPEVDAAVDDAHKTYVATLAELPDSILDLGKGWDEFVKGAKFEDDFISFLENHPGADSNEMQLFINEESTSYTESLITMNQQYTNDGANRAMDAIIAAALTKTPNEYNTHASATTAIGSGKFNGDASFHLDALGGVTVDVSISLSASIKLLTASLNAGYTLCQPFSQASANVNTQGNASGNITLSYSLKNGNSVSASYSLIKGGPVNITLNHSWSF